MMAIFAILLVAVVNLIPADVSTFTMVMHENETIRFTKQADGGWSAIELPKDSLGTFYVNGTKLTMKGEGKTHTQDFAKVLGVDGKTDWSQLKAITLGHRPVQIDRKKSGIDFILSEKKEGKISTRTFKVHWDLKKDK